MSSFRLTACFSAIGLILLLLVAHLVWRLAPHPGFAKELTVSGAIFFDQNKFRDLVLVPVLIAAQAAGAAALFYLHKTSLKNDLTESLATARLHLWGSLALLSALAVALALQLLPISGTLGAVLVTCLIYWRYLDNWEEAFGKAATITMAVLLLANNLANLSVESGFTIGLVVAALACLPAQAGRSSLELGYIISVIAIGVLLALAAPLFWFPGRTLSSWTTLDLIIFGLAAASVVLALRRALKPRDASDNALQAPSVLPLAIGLAIFVLPDLYVIHIIPDDYHFGEKLSAVRSLFHDGDLFTGLMPAHGLSDTAGWFVGWLGGDAGASSAVWGEIVAEFLGRVILLYLLMRILPGAPGILLAVVLPMPHLLTSYTPMPLLILLIPALVWLRPVWLAGVLGCLLSAACVFIAGGMGIAVAIAAFALLAISISLKDWRTLIPFLSGAALTGLVVVALFFREILGWAEYLLVSSRMNANIFAIGSAVPPIRPETLIKHAFVFLPAVAFIAAMATDYATNRNRMSLVRLALISAPLLILALLLTNYAMTRIDPGYPRAMAATLTSALLFVASLRITTPAAPRTLVAGLAFLPLTGLYLGSATYKPYIYGERAQHALAPSQARLPLPPFQADFHLGIGRDSGDHLARLQSLKRTFDTLLEEDEEILNLSNRSALSFYLDHSSAGFVTSMYNSAPMEFQQKTLDQLAEQTPRLALISAANYEHDGYALPLRTNAIYRFVLENYTPFQSEGIVYGWRKDLPTPEIATGFAEPVNLTDANWTNGVGNQDNSWSFFAAPRIAAQISRGDILVFRDGTERTVIERSGVNIRADGPALAPDAGTANQFKLKNGPFMDDKVSMWDDLFSLPDYASTPSAWGRSYQHLLPHLDMVLGEMDTAPRHDVTAAGDAGTHFSSAGPDPQWGLTFSTALDPKSAGILKLSIDCELPIVPVQIFWRTEAEDYSEAKSLRFNATYPLNLVPLDAKPAWLLSDPVTEFRIDIGENEHLCSPMALPTVEMLQRKELSHAAD